MACGRLDLEKFSLGFTFHTSLELLWSKIMDDPLVDVVLVGVLTLSSFLLDSAVAVN